MKQIQDFVACRRPRDLLHRFQALLPPLLVQLVCCRRKCRRVHVLDEISLHQTLGSVAGEVHCAAQMTAISIRTLGVKRRRFQQLPSILQSPCRTALITLNCVTNGMVNAASRARDGALPHPLAVFNYTTCLVATIARPAAAPWLSLRAAVLILPEQAGPEHHVRAVPLAYHLVHQLSSRSRFTRPGTSGSLNSPHASASAAAGIAAVAPGASPDRGRDARESAPRRSDRGPCGGRLRSREQLRVGVRGRARPDARDLRLDQPHLLLPQPVQCGVTARLLLPGGPSAGRGRDGGGTRRARRRRTGDFPHGLPQGRQHGGLSAPPTGYSVPPAGPPPRRPPVRSSRASACQVAVRLAVRLLILASGLAAAVRAVGDAGQQADLPRAAPARSLPPVSRACTASHSSALTRAGADRVSRHSAGAGRRTSGG